jgi:hypothetical protein
MRRFIGLTFSLALAAGLLSSQVSAQMGGGYGSGAGKSGSRVILAFRTMYGVNGPFIGAANPIRGVDGDELPWIVKSVKGSLTSRGKLTINVKGLVFPEMQGINDEPEFRAIVSCLTVSDGNVVESNVITDGFPANTKGNSKIKAQIALPQPCVAPIVMIVGSDEELWFVTTGY